MRWCFIVLSVVIVGCSSHVGPEGLAVGGPCIDEFDCVTGSYCLRGSSFPNGTCTTNCRSTDDCRGESLCAELESGVCLLPCTVDDDCGREGYACRPTVLRGAGERPACVGR